MTIYALSSGPGISGVAVIRLSGQDTSKVIQLLTGKEPPKPRVATLRKINKINTSELIDEGLILWFPGPESYTGEDMAEIQVHGSKAVVDALHSSLSDIENCRLAEPGEFTKLAFQNGKINLLKAESIADLISSETEIQRQQAIQIMNGKEIFVIKNMNSIKIYDLALAIKDYFKFKKKIIIKGRREGEKLYEELATKNEQKRIEIHKDFIILKNKNLKKIESYNLAYSLNSGKAEKLNKLQIISFLRKSALIK